MTCYFMALRAFAHTAVKGEVAADNSLILGGYSYEDGPVLFSGVGHATDDDNYLVTKVWEVEANS